MEFLFSHSLFACFSIAIWYIVLTTKKWSMKYRENKLFVILCIFSAMWSLGFCGVMVQTDPDVAYIWRAIGMFGVFGYLIIVCALVSFLTGMTLKLRIITEIFSGLGIVLYIGLLQKDLIVYKLTAYGMSYSFADSIWNDLYILYTVLLAIYVVFAMVYMKGNAKKKRERVFAVKILFGELAVVIGMVLDTIFPMIGLTAVPGSTYGQFVALLIIYNALAYLNRFHMNVENMSEFIYYAMDLPVIMYDKHHKLKFMNKSAIAYLGVDNNESNEGYKYPIESLFEVEPDIYSFEGTRLDIDALCKKTDTKCSLAINRVSDDYGDLIGYLIIANDLSEHLKTVEKLENAIKTADRANEAKSIFLANMSHEIRTPMHAIIGFSELVLKHDINADIREHVEDIKIASNNLLAIINDILDISKIESGKMEIVEGGYYTLDLLKDIVLIITNQAERKGLQFNLHIDSDIPEKLYGDKVRLRGVLINILNNAVKYTKKGSVSFYVDIQQKTEDFIIFEFRVVDTGMGIADEDKEKLFKTFERLDQKIHYNVEGSGLGLSIANGYVKLMGGEIKVDSVYGEGSTFTVIVPQKILSNTPAKIEKIYYKGVVEEKKKEEFRVTGVKALVVDDNRINLKVAQGILSAYGIEVEVADSGEGAIEICREKNFDLVFMDQMMPNVDGIMAMKTIREINPHYAKGGKGKIIVLTADAIGGARDVLLSKGFDEYIGKPLNINRLEYLIKFYVPSEQIYWTQKEENNPIDDSNEIDRIKELLEGIDVDMGLGHCGGQLESYMQVLMITYKYGAKSIEQLRELQEQQDYENYTIKVHALKSASLNIGAVEVSEMAKAQEFAGKAGNNGYIDEHMEELLEKYDGVLAGIQKLLEEKGMIQLETPGKKDSSKLDKETAKRLIECILEYVDEFEFDEVFNILEKIKEFNMEPEEKEVFGEIAEAMEELDTERVRAAIEKYNN